MKNSAKRVCENPMETELTATIKRATHTYNPQMGGLRTIRYADEVTTPTGIVDSIRFEDIDVGTTTCKLKKACPYPNRKEKDCRGCIYRHHVTETQMMVTCFEVKITMSDFHSGNGRNFCGNKNYYCIPREMASKVAEEIGKDSPVGILVWTGRGLRCYKPAQFIEIPESLISYLLYNALKKWCDGVQKLDE